MSRKEGRKEAVVKGWHENDSCFPPTPQDSQPFHCLHRCHSSLSRVAFLVFLHADHLFIVMGSSSSLFLMITALVLLLPSAAAADLSSDRQALLDFSAAVPHSLSRKLNWNTNSSVCTAWSGVTCSNATQTRVIELRLPGTAFYGSIPRNTLGRLDALSSLSLRSNALSGTLPPDILSLPSLRKAYLQQNNLSGDLPSNLSQQLAFLDLSFNSFTGNIPSSILNLNHLSTLNLNNNSLTGPIPDLSSLSNLQQLNLSNNNFNGSIPTSLQHFPASSFQGNSLLCGSPLQQCPSPISPSPSPSPAPAPAPSPVPVPSPASSHTKPPPSPKSKPPPPPSLAASKRKSKLATGSTVGIAVASSIALALLFLLCWILRRSKKRKAARNLAAGGKKEQFGKNRVLGDENSRLVFLQGGDSYDFDHLLTATAEVLGKGTYGTTYKATLQEGATLAVKRLKQALVSKMVFEQHMHNVARVSPHPSIIPLRAYYHSRNEHLLVYDYQPYGNLATLLHGNRPGLGRTLEWRPRLNICLGAAEGIAHIHSHSGGGRLIHGNIKSSNILLTRDLSGCMSDFGITPLVGLITTASRKAGYQAPEVMELGKYTQKSDVYSFGVVLLEVLMGKAPLEDGVDLPRWVQSVDRERWRAEVFDSKLKKNQNTEEEMAEMLQLALACVSRLPESRPDMDKAIKSIQQILHYPDESGNLLGL